MKKGKSNQGKEKRVKKVVIGLTDKEYKYISDYCELNMITMSKYIRSAAIKAIYEDRMETGKTK